MRLTKQYAYGLFASISKESSIEVLLQLQELVEIFNQKKEYMYALDTQVEDFQNMRDILNAEVDPMIINFLEVIAEDGMLHRLETITEDYRLILVEENILFDVNVYSAKDLSDQVKNKVEKLVKNRWGERSEEH